MDKHLHPCFPHLKLSLSKNRRVEMVRGSPAANFGRGVDPAMKASGEKVEDGIVNEPCGSEHDD